MYHCFKSVIGRGEYLDLITVNIYKTAVARVLLGMSPLTAHVSHFQKPIVRAHFVPLKLETKPAFFLTASVWKHQERVQNKAQNLSLRDQVFSVLKCNLLKRAFWLPLEKYLFVAVQIRQKLWAGLA